MVKYITVTYITFLHIFSVVEHNHKLDLQILLQYVNVY